MYLITYEQLLYFYRYATVCAINSRINGVATLVRNDLLTALVAQSPPDAATKWVAVRINSGLTVFTVYKPPRAPVENLPVYNHLVIYSGDFNSHHTTWGYGTNNEYGDKVAE